MGIIHSYDIFSNFETKATEIKGGYFFTQGVIWLGIFKIVLNVPNASRVHALRTVIHAYLLPNFIIYLSIKIFHSGFSSPIK